MLPKAKDGDDCFVVLNPHPYEVTTVVETELFEPSPNNFEFNMYDSNNNPVDCQVILEESIINMTRRVRLIYKYTYPAMSVTQFGIHSKIVDYKTERFTGDNSDEDIILKDKYKQIKISRETGLIESYVSNGTEYAHSGLFSPVMFDDNEDPWGWRLNKLGENYRNMPLDKSGKGLKVLKFNCHLMVNEDFSPRLLLVHNIIRMMAMKSPETDLSALKTVKKHLLFTTEAEVIHIQCREEIYI